MNIFIRNVLLKGQRAVSKKLTENRYRFTFPDLESALKNIYG